MGLFTKSIVFLLIAASIPLLYRQFADDKTVKFMSSYYSNYKSIDNFLRQSANHMDRAAKDYLPSKNQINDFASKVNSHVGSVIESTKSKLSNLDSGKKTDESKPKTRFCQCPNEDYGDKAIRLWTKDELSKYDGTSDGSKIYLGFLGLVYDVSKNSHHYAPGADYNAFAGRDATRAFLTGNFTHDLNDDLNGVDRSLFPQIVTWTNFYQSSYPVMGRIEGQFFDSRGCGTKALAEVKKILDSLEEDKKATEQQEKVFPECNTEYNGETKRGRVWCSTKSGGQQRDWVGVPRIDEANQRCVCLNLDDPEARYLGKLLRVYHGCDSKASECSVSQ